MLFGSYDILVCDLDGTLCNISAREHLASQGMWDDFHALLSNDTPRLAVSSFIDLLSFYWRMSTDGEDGPPPIYFLTGRPETYRPETERWLESNYILQYEDYTDIVMRPKDDWRSDYQLKEELLQELLRKFYGDSYDESVAKQRVLILDDRDKVVAHFRDLGYECWQVAQGAY